MAAMAAFVPRSEFSEPERRVLLCIFDALWADLGEEGSHQLVAAHRREDVEAEQLVAFARRPASACGDVVGAFEIRLGASPPQDIADFHLLLKALGRRTGCLALTGKRGPIHRHATDVVQGILKSWMVSPLPAFRLIGKVFKLALAAVCMGAPPGEQAVNWKPVGYAAPDLAALREAARNSAAIDFGACRAFAAEPEAPLGGGDAPPPLEVICDCVVVGSGPGGAVVAAELTEAGFRVALLETGRWEAAQEQKVSELHAQRLMYQEGGNFFTNDRNMTILAGSALGGGAAINWSCCLPPPEKVCQEWARDFGVDWAAGSEMSESVECARERLSMHSDAVRLNAANQVLMRGCERLGYQAEVAAQQGWEPTSPDDGGWCSLGWKHGARQGMHGSALADAARTGNFVLLDGCTAHEVLQDVAGNACGVRATLRFGSSNREVLVRGRGIVVAGGSLQTPLLLRRSGLRNPHIGKHLHLHPAMTIYGRFPEPINFLRGAPMTVVSRVVEDIDGRGYGAKIWVPNLHPVTWGALLPWQGAQEFKQAFAGYGHAAPLISLVRDQSEGKVWEGSDHRVHVSYTMGRVDKSHLQSAVEHAARILAAAGAQEIHSAHNAIEPLTLTGTGDEAQSDLEAWLSRLRAAGMQELAINIGSAHQMGTCRMAATPKLGAAKPTGETWEVPGLFVADTSAFPTASGVNPMWTCAALAHRVAQHVKQHLAATPSLAEPKPLRQRKPASCVSAFVAVPKSAQRSNNENSEVPDKASKRNPRSSDNTDVASDASSTSSR